MRSISINRYHALKSVSEHHDPDIDPRLVSRWETLPDARIDIERSMARSWKHRGDHEERED
jgi:hypothetical protein